MTAILRFLPELSSQKSAGAVARAVGRDVNVETLPEAIPSRKWRLLRAEEHRSRNDTTLTTRRGRKDADDIVLPHWSFQSI